MASAVALSAQYTAELEARDRAHDSDASWTLQGGRTDEEFVYVVPDPTAGIPDAPDPERFGSLGAEDLCRYFEIAPRGVDVVVDLQEQSIHVRWPAQIAVF